MSTPANQLIQVATYNSAALEYMYNYSVFIKESNKQMQNFQDAPGQLGQTVQIALPMRASANDSLIYDTIPAEQRYHPLVCDKQSSTSYAYTAQQFVFNVEKWFKEFGKSQVAAISSKVEINVAQNCRTAPYRFYGNGRTQINSVTQVAEMLEQYRSYGLAQTNLKVVFPNYLAPAFVTSQGNMFFTKRNDEQGQSWMLGDWDNCSFYRSNVLPTHRAGSVGNENLPLTVVSTNDPTGNNITEITFSGAPASDFDAIRIYDSLEQTGPGRQNYLTFQGQSDSTNTPVQIRSISNSGSNGAGQVTVQFEPALCSTPGSAVRNIQNNIVAGMQFEVLPDHRCGIVIGSDALYLAMPKMPELISFPSSSMKNEETGVSLRTCAGSIFGKNTTILAHDLIYGHTAIPEYVMKIAIPV